MKLENIQCEVNLEIKV